MKSSLIIVLLVVLAIGLTTIESALVEENDQGNYFYSLIIILYLFIYPSSRIDRSQGTKVVSEKFCQLGQEASSLCLEIINVDDNSTMVE